MITWRVIWIDIKEYFEVEEEERRKQAQAAWNWDDMMERLEKLEAREAAGDGMEGKKEEETQEEQVAALKDKGNDAFARRKYEKAVKFYSHAIELDPSSHILYGNRAAAYHRLKKYKQALEDSDVAVSLQESWVKGHYRRACALAALDQYEEAAQAFERAMELCPTDDKLVEKAQQMRIKLNAKAIDREDEKTHPKPEVKSRAAMEPASTISPSRTSPVRSASSPSPASVTSASTAFSGNIVEHELEDKKEPVVSNPLAPSKTRYSRFKGTNYTGQTVMLEPVGEAVSISFLEVKSLSL
ncbi:hypothetical protein PsorP6_014237 [Peronosclerospora sorghi]|uniref:Uncharacterized protein n=1 Tax=Peronosclerospora sorghi TaxID=230839 RepID=A0ACC0VIJ0_9STRA|nr:hypothetical protein PsorP6_014237 [Peronosclerospora sorghi]